ncbi:MAG: FHA domain-containing protein [Planctomycetaceae bacterium]
MNTSGQIYPDDTVGYFRIACSTGRRQPIEPVALGEFLIGSAAHCHLRFGDWKIPDVHTILNVDREIVLLRAAVADPPLYVNGVVETECRLEDGDLVELGDYRLLFRLAASEHRITLDEDVFATGPLSSDETAANSVRTAEQVIERLEEQIELVEELAHSPAEGMLELLKAVASSESSAATPDVLKTSTESELKQVTTLIQKHHEASRIRLESLTAVLDNVVSQQKMIADTLQVLSDRIQALDSGNTYQQRRASA